MTTKNYLLLCAGIAVAVVAAVLLIPDLSTGIEQVVLRFLSTNAR